MTAPGPAGPPTPNPAGPPAAHPAGPTSALPAEYPAAHPGPPAPPPGPGVQPPFPAPPSEGRTVRLWLGLGAAALAVLLCCGGGSVALVGLFVVGTEAVNEQSRAVVGDYFEAVSRGQYGRAYAMLCDGAKKRESAQAFEGRVAAEPDIDSYEVGDVVLGTTDLVVPVEVSYAAGGGANLRATLVQSQQTGEFQVCRVD